jgi:hypothetical protein
MLRATALLPLFLLACLGMHGCAAPGGGSEAAASAQVAVERQVIIAVHDERRRVQRRAGSVSRPYGDTGRYRGSLQARQQMAEIARQHDLRPLDDWPITLLDLYCVVFELPPGRPRDEFLAAIAAHPQVVLAQPMQQFSTLAAGALGPRSGGVSFATTNIPAAHEWAMGRGIKVALVDTGIDREHPGLQGRVLRQLDFVGAKAFPPAEEAHGLAVAGVIAARANQELGMVGVAPQAELLALRACWHTDPVHAVCNSFTLARGIAAAVDHGADVINLSLTGPPDPLLERLLTAAMKQKVVVIGAVPESGTAGFPTTVRGVIPVRSAELAGMTRAGELPAPGHNILTLRPGGGYELASGSSLAAAHISGVVALLLERRGDLASADLHELLSTYTEPVMREGSNVRVVNACRALASLVDGHCPEAVEHATGAPRLVAPAGVGGRMKHE